MKGRRWVLGFGFWVLGATKAARTDPTDPTAPTDPNTQHPTPNTQCEGEQRAERESRPASRGRGAAGRRAQPGCGAAVAAAARRDRGSVPEAAGSDRCGLDGGEASPGTAPRGGLRNGEIALAGVFPARGAAQQLCLLHGG